MDVLDEARDNYWPICFVVAKIIPIFASATEFCYSLLCLLGCMVLTAMLMRVFFMTLLYRYNDCSKMPREAFRAIVDAPGGLQREKNEPGFPAGRFVVLFF